MSRWTRRRVGSEPDTAPVEPSRAEPTSPVLMEDYDGLLLLRSPEDHTLRPADIADLARALRSEDGTVTLVAGAEGETAGAIWPRLGESLDSLREAGTRSVRLVMAGAGHDRPDRPAVARRITDAWGMVVEAPDGPVLVVPGGSVFVPPGDADGGWWRYAPGLKPELLGPRTPAPRWQSALRGMPSRTAGGCVVDQIPAGVLIRPAEAAAPQPGDLFHAIPIDPKRPTVVVGVPWGEDVAASEVAQWLSALPPSVRPGVRLSPGGLRDLLPLGQSVAWMLGVEVEVTTGLPLFAADGPLGTYGVRSVLVGPDGTPRWLPFVDAVMCSPSQDPENTSAPRLLRWSPPLPGVGRAEEGTVHLSDRWQVTVTRAGLWVGPRGGAQVSHSSRTVGSEGPVIEVGRPGEGLDPSLGPVLSRLLDALAPDLRERGTLHVHATPPDGGRELRGLAARHGLRVIRFAQPLGGPATAPAPQRPAAPKAVRQPASVPPGAPVPVPTIAHRPVPGPAASLTGTVTAPAEAEAARAPAPAPAPPAPAPAPRGPLRTSAGNRLRPVPVLPRHRSTEAERRGFRALAGTVWERHSAAVARALAGMPALRGQEQEAARTDLIALRLYLQDGEGPLNHGELIRSLGAGEDRLLPYAACLASGLGRLPSYRGVALRGTGPDGTGLGELRPGAMLRGPAPVSATPLDPAGRTGVPGVGYAIWSITGRRVRQLLDEGDEVVFAPGTAFRVLDVRTGGAVPLVLLRQLPDAQTAPGGLEDADHTALARLDQALKDRTSPAAGTGTWPERCAGPIGDD